MQVSTISHGSKRAPDVSLQEIKRVTRGLEREQVTIGEAEQFRKDHKLKREFLPDSRRYLQAIERFESVLAWRKQQVAIQNATDHRVKGPSKNLPSVMEFVQRKLLTLRRGLENGSQGMNIEQAEKILESINSEIETHRVDDRTVLNEVTLLTQRINEKKRIEDASSACSRNRC